MSYMGQLTIYLPKDVEEKTRRGAKRVRKSVSAYIASLVGAETEKDANGWPVGFEKLFGSAQGTGVEAPPDPPRTIGPRCCAFCWIPTS